MDMVYDEFIYVYFSANSYAFGLRISYTAVSRKVVGRSARDNPERDCGWSCLPCSPKKFERMAREATDICSRVLMESNKSKFDSYSC